MTRQRFDLWQREQWWMYLDAHEIGVLYAVLGADEHGYAYTVPLDLVSGIDAGEPTYNEWTTRYLRDVHDAPASYAELISLGKARSTGGRSTIGISMRWTGS